MAKTTKAGAADVASVNGHDISIDREAATSWDAFRLLRILNDEGAESIAKMEAAIAYAALVSGLTEDGIVEIAGGGSVQVADVVAVVAAIIEAASPKN